MEPKGVLADRDFDLAELGGDEFVGPLGVTLLRDCEVGLDLQVVRVLPAKLEVAEALLVGRVDVVSGDGVVVAVQHLEELVSFASAVGKQYEGARLWVEVHVGLDGSS